MGCTIPGGYGAAGQPNDGWHQHLHQLNTAYCKVAMGWANSLALRKNLDGLNLGVQTTVTTKCLVGICFTCATPLLKEMEEAQTLPCEEFSLGCIESRCLRFAEPGKL